MNKYSGPKDYEQTLKDNKPRIVMPIINTIFAVILFVLVIIFTINGSFKIGYSLLYVFILIMFPLASWYTSYFSKKKNVKKIYNYQKETDVIVKYTARYKHYKPVTEKDVKVKFTYELGPINDHKVTFDVDKCMLREHNGENLMITFGISFGGVEVNYDTKQVLYPSGVLPCSIWYSKKLKVPAAEEGTIYVDFNNYSLNKKLLFQLAKRADTYYDTKQGWLCIGERKATVLDENIKFADGAIMVLREGEFVALFLEVGKNIQIA